VNAFRTPQAVQVLDSLSLSYLISSWRESCLVSIDHSILSHVVIFSSLAEQTKLKITTNHNATLAFNALYNNEKAVDASIERLSTGKRINSSADDASGLAIASKMTSQINGLNQAARNINNAIGLLQTADNGLENIEQVLQRLRELSVQSASGAVSDDQRNMIGEEVTQLVASIDSIVEATKWNSVDLLDGTFQDKTFQIGANDNDRKSVSLDAVSASTLFDYTPSEISFTNGDFSSLDISQSGSIVTLDGWDVYLEQIVLGRDGSSGSTQVAGFSSPEDSSPYPVNGSGNVSGGDNSVPSQASYSYTLSSGLQLVSTMTTSSGGDTVHGPYTVSQDSVFLSAGSTVSFDWRAQGGSDAYDVFAYLVDVDSGSTIELLNLTGSGTQDSGWATVTHAVSTEGNYKFVFASGTFDETFGRAAGASLFINNVEVSGSVASIGYSEMLLHESQSDAASAISKIDTALATITTARGNIGAEMNVLSYTLNSVHNTSQNTSSSRSKIEDSDYAVEMSELSRTKIIRDAATAMLTQANQQSKMVLDLLK
jgi:flagellin